LASVYHKLPELFVSNFQNNKKKEVEEENDEDEQRQKNLKDNDDEIKKEEDSNETNEKKPKSLIDLGDLLGGESSNTNEKKTSTGLNIDDLFGGESSNTNEKKTSNSFVGNTVLDEESGVKIMTNLIRNKGEIEYKLRVQNNSNQTISSIAIKFNKNFFGVNPTSQLLDIQPLSNGEHYDLTTILQPNQEAFFSDKLTTQLQVAIKTSKNTSYYSDELKFNVLLEETGKLTKEVNYLLIFRIL
jgi:hypothetical protein